ncbi:MAG: cytochrome c oxidase subunit II [Planctomycetota bacterium]
MWPFLQMPLWAQSSGSFWLPEPISDAAAQVDDLFYFIFYVSAFFFTLIVVLMVLFVILFRRREGVARAKSPSHNLLLEVTWSVIPIMIVLYIFYRGFDTYIDMRTSPREALEINVTAQMWKWFFRYPNGTTIDELHVPVDQPVRLVMQSKDVTHSLYIPVLRLKMDLVPGRYTKTWFHPKQPGTFDLVCAEYCGDGHSTMVTRAVVHEPGGFERWLEEAGNYLKTLPPVEAGQVLYSGRGGCAQCHSIDGSARVGPTFLGIWGETHRMTDGSTALVDEDYIRESILEPGRKIREGYRNQMPSFKGVLNDDEVGYLIDYIKSLKKP